MDKIYKNVGKTLVYIALGLVVAFPSAWFIMLALGILHHRWASVPPLGYWETYVLFAALNLIGSAVKTGIRPARTER
jgi:hypothetical protein